MKKLLALCVALALVALGSAPAWAWTIQDGADHLYNPTITGPVTLNETTNTELLTQTCAGWGLTTPVGAWSCSGDTITRTASASDLTITNAAATVGTVYKVTVTYATITAGTFSVSVGGIAQVTHGTAGTFTEYFTAGASTAVTITAVAASAGTITVSTTSVTPSTNYVMASAGPVMLRSTMTNTTANEVGIHLLGRTEGTLTGLKTAVRSEIDVASGTSAGTEYIHEFYANGASKASIDSAGNTVIAGTFSAGFGNVSFSKLLVQPAQAVTCSAGAGVATLTITPTAGYVEVTNSDADGCDITMGEGSIVVGTVVTICVVSNAGTTVNFADTAGVSELAGAFAANVDDCLTLRYGNTTTWREVSRSAN